MAGLVAVIREPGAPSVSQAEVDQLARCYDMLRQPSERTHAGNDNARTVVFHSGGAAPSLDVSPPSWIVAVGRIRSPQPWTARHSENLARSDGHFAVVSYDADHDELLVANDPMGMSAVYVAHKQSRMYVSTSALALAMHLKCPASRLGVESFLLSGYQFGTRTNWDAIERLEPATCITVTASGISRRTYWRATIDRQVAGLPMQAAADHGLEVLRATCSEYLSGAGYCADLTGGFDSRLLTLSLESAGIDFCTNTRSAPWSDDTDIAREIATRKRWEWHDLALGAHWPLDLPTLLPVALAWGDAQLEVLQLSRVINAHQRLSKHRSLLLCSAGGEHFERNWESEFFNAGRSSGFNMARWIDMTALKRGDDFLLHEDADASVRADFRLRLEKWIEPYSGELNTTKLEMLHAFKSTGHGGAYRGADGGFLETQLPYYFKPIFGAASSIDHRHRNGHALHRQMIARLDEEIASVRTTHGGSALPARPWRLHREMPYHVGIARKVATKVAGGLAQRWIGSDPEFPWQQAANGAVLHELRKTDLLVWSEMRVAPLLRSDRFETMLASALRPGFSANAVLGRVITTEMALRLTDTALP